jgi:serine/threonine protein kinase
MWALGIILYQLVASYNHPFPCENVFALTIAIKDDEPDLDLLPSTVSPFIKDTIKALLNKNPEKRLDAQTLIDKDEIQV